MLEKYFHIKWSEEFDPSREGIEQIFGEYGRLSKILIGNPVRYFIIKFQRSTAAMRCQNDKLTLRQRHGLIIENLFFYKRELGKDPEDRYCIDSDEDAGPADPDLPSLMQLNEACLLHILSFVPIAEIPRISFVCRRMNRLCKERVRKNRSLKCYSNKPMLDILFFSTSALTELYIELPDFPKRSLLDMALLCCTNLKRLHVAHVDDANISSSSSIALQRLLVTVEELIIENAYPYNFLYSKPQPQLKKLKLKGNFIDIRFGTRFIELLPNLTTLLIPYYDIDLGAVLSYLPQLRALACTVGRRRTTFPVRHDLSEFYFRSDPESYLVHDVIKEKILKLRQVCPNLRHLRIGSCAWSFIPLLHRLLPLDGLHLNENVDLFGEFHTLEILKDLKIVLIPNVGWDECSKVLSNFSKLEVIYCKSMLQRHRCEYRASKKPLIVIGYKAKYHWPELGNVIPVGSVVDHFGNFSIYDDIDFFKNPQHIAYLMSI